MELVNILGKLEQAKDFLTSTAPDALDGVADALHNIEQSVRDAGVYLRKFQGTGSVSTGCDTQIVERADKLRCDCKNLCPKAGSQAIGGLPDGVKQLIAALIVSLLDKLFPSA